jgi:membrane-associated phospholipid phosphatase
MSFFCSRALLLVFFLCLKSFCQIHDKNISYARGYSFTQFAGDNSIPSDKSIIQLEKKPKKDSINKCLNFFRNSSLGQTVTQLLSASLLTGFLMLSDDYTWKFTHDIRKNSEVLKTGLDFAVDVGDGKYNLAAAGLFAINGFLGNSYRSKRTSLQIVESLLLSGLAVQTLKRVFGRESPAMTSAPTGKWRPFPRLEDYNRHQPKYYAMPSGHMTTITTTLTVIANNYPEYKWIRPVSYGILGLVGVGLVSNNMHWYSDFPLGIFLGYTIGNFISKPNKNEIPIDSDQNKEYFSISPYVNSNYSGVQLSVHF